jgi:endoglucanase
MIMKKGNKGFIVQFLVLFCMLAYQQSYAQTENLRIVDQYGQLQVNGTRIVNEYGDTVALRGMSLFWSQWIGKYYNYDCIEWLRDDWKCMVVRAAMAVESGGYLDNPETEMNKVKTVIDACIDLGIYVIVDWHSHHAESQTEDAITFFTEIATLYGDEPNLIYEIYNEPLQVSWTNVIKPYADTVIAAIRAIDTNNIILVGTPTWSQDVDIAAGDPIDDENVAYSLHFYATTHTGWLRSKATYALSRGIALWVNEFGTCESSGDGIINYAEMETWFDFMDQRMISWCNWSIADKDETSAALIPGASDTGGWTSDQITESGTLVRDRLISWFEQGYEPIPPVINIHEQKDPLASIEIVPNPFLLSALINVTILNPQRLKIEIFNSLGQQIDSYNYCAYSAGKQQIELNAARIGAGSYFCRILSQEGSSSVRFQVIR